MTYNAGERKDIRRAEKVAKLAEQNRGEVITQVASTIIGRSYLWDRLASAHIFTTSFSPDPLMMAFREGERNQGIQLLEDWMRVSPDTFILAMREANERRTSSDTATGKRTGSEEPGRIDTGSTGSTDDEPEPDDGVEPIDTTRYVHPIQ